ncbi:hypothetical protein [Bradyrhizobium sp. Ash2021]|uniref:hypothetical protein n=1 Tax=Bradyrhizobium sp. Ash2021 TaxID=2954771 RepID=UPI0028156392|nr:hypothetical protein [Bradyrhizobium sp. Ash2021]WMT76754.1 hypothetical protein NL528_10470 [Bradyrhizobium sp. Ash2021]
MNAITESRSRSNRLEGFALTAIFQGLPTFAIAVLMLKLAGRREIVGEKGGAAIFVVLSTIFYALFTPWLAAKFPNRLKYAHEPLFFDANLSFAEKIAQWRTRPAASL